LINQARGADRALRLRRVPEGQKNLIEFPQLSSGQKESLLVVRGRRGPAPNPEHADDVGHDNEKIDEMEAAKDHGRLVRVYPRNRESRIQNPGDEKRKQEA